MLCNFFKNLELFWTLQRNRVRDVLFLLFLKEMLRIQIFGNLLSVFLKFFALCFVKLASGPEKK